MRAKEYWIPGPIWPPDPTELVGEALQTMWFWAAWAIRWFGSMALQHIAWVHVADRHDDVRIIACGIFVSFIGFWLNHAMGWATLPWKRKRLARSLSKERAEHRRSIQSAMGVRRQLKFVEEDLKEVVCMPWSHRAKRIMSEPHHVWCATSQRMSDKDTETFTDGPRVDRTTNSTRETR